MRIRTAMLATLLAAIAPAAPGAAQSGGAGYDDGYVFAGYTDHPIEVTRVIRDLPRNPTRWCVHWPIALASVVGDVDGLTPDQVRALTRQYRGELVEGAEYALICYRSGETSPYRVALIVYRRRAPTADEITTIETVEEYARALITMPEPAIATAPPPDRLVVGFETWFATPVPLDAPVRYAQAGPLWARAEPVPIEIAYDFGNGSSITCPVPAEPSWPGIHDADRPDCTRYTYLDSRSDTGVGHFVVSVTVTYDVWLTTSDDPTPRRADTREGPTVEQPVTVREIQAVIR